MPPPSERAADTVVAWTVFTFTFPWLLFIAAVSQPSYQWSLLGLRGVGTSGAFWVVALTVALAALVLYLGWRGARRSFQLLVVLWHLGLFGLLTYGAWRWGEQMVFHGAAFGIVVPLAWIGPLVSGSVAGAAIWWVVQDLRSPAPQPPRRTWRDLDRRAVLVAGVTTSIAICCHRLGAPDGTLAKVAVLATIASALAIASALGISLPSHAELRREQALKGALRAQLEVLQARTHPHFLFNSLNTVAGLIEEDPRRAEQVVERLAELYRHVLGRSGRERVALEVELRAVVDYLEIEKVRFGERLRWRLEVEPGLEQVEVLPFLLQPLVENAVLHGIAGRLDGGQVCVTARRRSGKLELEVEDDGPGFGGSSSHRGTGTSFDELARRLELAYGPAARLHLAPGLDAGARVTLCIPCEPPLRGMV